MGKAIIYIAALLIGLPVYAQRATLKKPVHKAKRNYGVVEAPPVPQIYLHVSQMAEYRGGNAALQKFLDEHLTYPQYAHEAGVQGKIVVRFMVNEDGSISNVAIAKGIGYGCDEEAVRVVKAMPPWKAAKNDGRACRSMFFLPVVFKIE